MPRASERAKPAERGGGENGVEAQTRGAEASYKASRARERGLSIGSVCANRWVTSESSGATEQ